MGNSPKISDGSRVCPEPVRVGPIALALLAQYEAQYGIVAGPVAPLGKAV